LFNSKSPEFFLKFEIIELRIPEPIFLDKAKRKQIVINGILVTLSMPYFNYGRRPIGTWVWG
jgi:hypothetical protein